MRIFNLALSRLSMRLLCSLLMLIVLSGCRLGPRYEVPEVCVPDEWKTPSVEEVQSKCLENWWDVFQDCELDRLEQEAMLYNPNLYVAYERILRAKAQAQEAKSALFPQITFDPSYTDQGILQRNYFASSFTGIERESGFTIPQSLRIHQYQITLPLDLSYEVDLWGKLQSRYESAFYNAQAETEAYLTALLSLTTDVASVYYQIRALDSSLELYRHTIQSYEKNVELAELRYTKGLVTELDVSEAKLQVSNTEADYYDLIRQRRLQEDLLATLIGLPASDFCLAANPLEELPPPIPAGIPSDILRQRPDIAEAERTMASEHALIGVAYASYFPSLSLTATYGWLSPIFKKFLRGISRYWALGASSSQMLFDGGHVDATVAESYARFGEASGNYQQTVLTAFQEVEDALVNLEYQAKEYEQLDLSVSHAKKSYDITMLQNLNGLVNYLNVVQTEIAQLNAKSRRVKMLGNRYQSTILLIKAMGGSWDYVLDSDCE